MPGRTPANASPAARRAGSVSLPVIAAPALRRRSLGPWRALSLLLVHVIFIAHIAHWLSRGQTLTPVEPSESMATLRSGAVNAGAIFFAVSILATMLFGRFFCGWGCHFIAYQDLCGWLLRRMGITPKPLRSRLLLLMPLALALYMFVWPVAYRLALSLVRDDVAPLPQFSAHFTTRSFWQTFPGWGFGLATVFVAGFSIVYFLGSKGFCTYACPYGAFYGLADRLAPLRVRVRPDACDHTGTCTTVCTSNVHVAAEVARYGMVVSPGCMKCGDCIRACPNDALSFGLGRPAIFAERRADRGLSSAARLSWSEELFLVAAFVICLLAWRGLYGGFPLLMSAGLAAILASIFLLAWRLLRQGDVTLQSRALKSAGRWHPGGWIVAGAACVLAVATVHGAAVQAFARIGGYHYDRTAVADRLLVPGFAPARDLSPQQRLHRDGGLAALDRCARISVIQTADLSLRRSWLELLAGRLPAAESLAQRAVAAQPEWPYLQYHLGRVYKVAGRTDDAIAAWKKALALDPELHEAETELTAALIAAHRTDEAIVHLDAVLRRRPNDADALYYRGVIAAEAGDFALAIPTLRRSVLADATRPEAHYQLGSALASSGDPAAAVTSLEEAIVLRPDMAEAHYNLAVARFMLGDREAALTSARRAAELAPDDTQTSAFIEMLLRQVE